MADDEARLGPKPPVSSVELERVRSRVERGLFKSGAAPRLGRFEVRDRIGSGASGVVYEGYDPELGRRVALKVLDPGADTGTRAEDRRRRLVREAQALAQLTHPNVVTVFDVGSHQGTVFIAMELVEGETFREWLAHEKRGRQAVLGALVKAGRGLAAAHERGLVHRDFKPDNVVIGSDGRVTVVDFGLARLALDKSADGPPPDSDAAQGDELASPLTRTGARLGTPVYMAPEQYDAGPIDERADQFAFCVVAFEALHGSRPFAGETIDELRANVRSGRYDRAFDSSGAGSRFDEAIRRGLRSKPEDRFPSMGPLLHELDPGPSKGRQRWILVALAAAAASLGAFAVARATESRPSCDGAAAELAGVWDSDVKRDVRASFENAEAPRAAESFGRAAELLDRRARAWTAMRTEACEATHVEGRQSERTLDLRMRCLDRRRGEMKQLTTFWREKASRRVVGSSVSTVIRLPRIERCDDVDALAAGVPPPDDTETRQKVEEVEELIARASLESQSGFDRRYELTAEALMRAKAIDYAPSRAKALSAHAVSHRLKSELSKAEKMGYEAARVAAAAKDDETAAYAWTELVFVVGFMLNRTDEGLVLARSAEAAVQRLGGGTMPRARLLNNLALVYWRRAEYREALKRYREALEVVEADYGRGHARALALLNNIGDALLEQGKLVEARRMFERARATAVATFGEESSPAATASARIARVMIEQGEVDAAIQTLRRAIIPNERQHGPDYPQTALLRLDLADALVRNGELVEARQLLAGKLELFEKTRSGDHPDVATVLELEAAAASAGGQLVEADALLRRALGVREREQGKEHPAVARTLVALGRSALARKDLDSAKARCRRASAVVEKAYGKDSPLLALPIACLGEVGLRSGDIELARERLERARRLWKGSTVDPRLRGEAAFSLARALWEDQAARPRALQVAGESMSLLEGAGPRAKMPLDDVRLWVRARKAP